VQERGGRAEYIGIADLEGLLGLVQYGVIELHPWGSRGDLPGRPDRVVFDFDPAPDVPWAEVVRGSAGVMTLRGFVYRIDDACQVCAGRYVPVAPGKARFAFTVIGPVSRPSAHVGAGGAALASFRATPTPFVHALRLEVPGAGTLHVIDASGREVRRLETAGVAAVWDGRDERGVMSRAGVYWVRFSGAAGTATRRVVKLGR